MNLLYCAYGRTISERRITSKIAVPGRVIRKSTVVSSLATTSASAFQFELFWSQRTFHEPTTSFDVNAFPSLHLAPLGKVIVNVFLTGKAVAVAAAVGALVAAGADVGGTAVGAVVGGAVVGLRAAVAGAAVGAGVAAGAHATAAKINENNVKMRINLRILLLLLRE